MQTKADLRYVLRTRLAALTSEEKAAASAALCQRLQSDPGIGGAKRLGIFLPLPDEPDLLDFYRTFSGTLVLPDLREDRWEFREILDLDDLRPGPCGLPLPRLGAEYPVSELDRILVPGRAFTPAGDRLGRGRGIYDRLLAGAAERSLGIGFACQLLPELPREAHDIRLAAVWTA